MEEAKKNGFWERISNILNERNIKESDFARMTELSTQNFTKWKAGAIPRADIAVKLSKVLGVSVEYLITGIKTNIDELNLIKTKYDEIVKIVK